MTSKPTCLIVASAASAGKTANICVNDYIWNMFLKIYTQLVTKKKKYI